MADFTFNIAKGRLAYYASLPATNDALIAVLVEASGVETDAVLKDKDDLAAVFSGATNEQTTGGRKTLASVTVTVDDTNDRVNIDCADITWTALTGNAISDIVIGYDPDTTGGTDADIIPLTMHDFSITTDGTDVVATVADFARAS